MPGRLYSVKRMRRLRLCALLVPARASSRHPSPRSGPRAGALAIERVAALPSLIGTAPSSPIWSPDGKRLAFLWNDQGWPGRNVWIVNADGSGLRRITALRPDLSAVPPGDAGRGSGRSRVGRWCTEVVWASPRHVLFIVEGCARRARRGRQRSRAARSRATPGRVGPGDVARRRQHHLPARRRPVADAPQRRRRAARRAADRHRRARHRRRAARHLQPRRPRGGHRRVGRRLGAVLVVARRHAHRLPRRRSPAYPQGAVPVVSRRRDSRQRTAPRLSWRRERAADAPRHRPEDARRQRPRAARAGPPRGQRLLVVADRPTARRSRRRTLAPSAGCTWWSRGPRRSVPSGTTGATRASIRRTSRAGIPTAGGFWWSPTSASAISCT